MVTRLVSRLLLEGHVSAVKCVVLVGSVLPGTEEPCAAAASRPMCTPSVCEIYNVTLPVKIVIIFLMSLALRYRYMSLVLRIRTGSSQKNWCRGTPLN